MKEIRWQMNALIGLVIALLGLFVAVVLVPLQVQNVEGFGLPAYTYPRLILSLCIVSALVLIVGSLVRRLPQPIEGVPMSRSALLSVGSVLRLVLLYVVLLPYIGFLFASPIFLASCLLLFDERSWIPILSISLLVPLAIYGLFTGALGLILP